MTTTTTIKNFQTTIQTNTNQPVLQVHTSSTLKRPDGDGKGKQPNGQNHRVVFHRRVGFKRPSTRPIPYYPAFRPCLDIQTIRKLVQLGLYDPESQRRWLSGRVPPTRQIPLGFDAVTVGHQVEENEFFPQHDNHLPGMEIPMGGEMIKNDEKEDSSHTPSVSRLQLSLLPPPPRHAATKTAMYRAPERMEKRVQDYHPCVSPVQPPSLLPPPPRHAAAKTAMYRAPKCMEKRVRDYHPCVSPIQPPFSAVTRSILPPPRNPATNPAPYEAVERMEKRVQDHHPRVSPATKPTRQSLMIPKVLLILLTIMFAFHSASTSLHALHPMSLPVKPEYFNIDKVSLLLQPQPNHSRSFSTRLDSLPFQTATTVVDTVTMPFQLQTNDIKMTPSPTLHLPIQPPQSHNGQPFSHLTHSLAFEATTGAVDTVYLPIHPRSNNSESLTEVAHSLALEEATMLVDTAHLSIQPQSSNSESSLAWEEANALVDTVHWSILQIHIPSTDPSSTPAVSPSAVPSTSLSVVFSVVPSMSPSAVPWSSPCQVPSTDPSSTPAVSPSAVPSTSTSVVLSVVPSMSPLAVPSIVDLAVPWSSPSQVLSTDPSSTPSVSPSAVPSTSLSVVLRVLPSMSPLAEHFVPLIPSLDTAPFCPHAPNNDIHLQTSIGPVLISQFHLESISCVRSKALAVVIDTSPFQFLPVLQWLRVLLKAWMICFGFSVLLFILWLISPSSKNQTKHDGQSLNEGWLQVVLTTDGCKADGSMTTLGPLLQGAIDGSSFGALNVSVLGETAECQEADHEASTMVEEDYVIEDSSFGALDVGVLGEAAECQQQTASEADHEASTMVEEDYVIEHENSLDDPQKANQTPVADEARAHGRENRAADGDEPYEDSDFVQRELGHVFARSRRTGVMVRRSCRIACKRASGAPTPQYCF